MRVKTSWIWSRDSLLWAKSLFLPDLGFLMYKSWLMIKTPHQCPLSLQFDLDWFYKRSLEINCILLCCPYLSLPHLNYLEVLTTSLNNSSPYQCINIDYKKLNNWSVENHCLNEDQYLIINHLLCYAFLHLTTNCITRKWTQVKITVLSSTSHEFCILEMHAIIFLFQNSRLNFLHTGVHSVIYGHTTINSSRGEAVSSIFIINCSICHSSLLKLGDQENVYGMNA